MNKNSCILILFILLMSIGVQAQIDSVQNKLAKDTVAILYDKSIVKPQIDQINDSLNPKVFKPDPLRAVWMGAIIPGYGQILNRKYWKLPIIYGGFLGFAYVISFNSSHYQSYKTAYLDILRYSSDNSYKNIVDKNPGVATFYKILPKETIDNYYGGISGFTPKLQGITDSYRRYRDLSIILSIAYYALTIVDAYVDAQLYDFDISPDLSMHVQPSLLKNSYGVNNTLGLQCSISLK